ncbi:hypothetical protein F4803DRAFT_4792 [Xylaria telfairii]|nr:hypothetical protein F4803DRAFT_4792 [Xylaria telfairii]
MIKPTLNKRPARMSREHNKSSKRGEAENDKAIQARVIRSSVTTNEQSPSYSECLASFQTFLDRCSRYDGLNSSRGLERCSEEYSRLQIWGYQQGTALRPSVPSSSAATLQARPELQGILLEIYEQIIDGFDQLNQLPSTSLAESLNLLLDDHSDDDGSEAQSDMSDDLGIEDNPGIAFRTLKCIFESIEELYRLSSLLRRPRLSGRYPHSTQPILDSACQQEYQRIRQKFLIWQKQQDETLRNEDIEPAFRVAHSSEEKTANPEYAASNQPTEEIHHSLESILARRVAISNIIRRRKFGYRHSETIYPIDIRSDTSPSTALSHATPVGKYEAYQVPAPPKPHGLANSLRCPCCHKELSIEKMNVQTNWKQHVFQDLRPYICTFSDCSDSDRLFFTRHDWIYHEMQMHRRKWICQSCPREYVSKLEMTEHLQHVHNSSISDSELTALLEISERPINEDYVDQCPFCHLHMGTGELLGHMAGHMEELALLSPSQSHGVTGESEDAMSHLAHTTEPKGLSNLRTPSPSSSQPPYRSIHSEPDIGQPKPSRRNVKIVNTRASEQQDYRTTPLGAKKGYRFLRVVYCCNCNDGPWNPTISALCQSCQHSLCSYCRREERRIRAI